MSVPQSIAADDPSPTAQTAAQDKSVLAAEYALGTLDADDRANVHMLMAIDPAFAAAVADWERRLGELHALVGPVEAPPSTWDWIKARIAVEPQPAKLWLPSNAEIAARPLRRAPRDADTESDAPAPPVPPDTVPQAVAERLTAPPLIALWRARARGWRRATFGTAALAAALLALAAVRELRPDLLPEELRPVPHIVEKPVEVVRTVEVVREVASPQMAEYVAMLRADAQPAAFAVTLDLARGALSVRRIAAELPQGKDYELWLLSDKYPAPRSLGLVGTQEYTVRRDLSGYDAPTLRAATFAVSLEPAGGSPSGVPTGPMLFSGKLTQTTPAAFPAPTP